MSIFNIFRQPPPPPPPEPFYKKSPVATFAVILTLVGMFVVGPIGYMWNGMAEELKKKVDNQTLQLMIQKDREALQRQAEELKEREKKDQTQDAAILENQKTLIMLRAPQAVKVTPSPNMKTVKKAEPQNTIVEGKKPIPPDLFAKYFELAPEVQVKYKKYLEAKGYDVSGL